MYRNAGKLILLLYLIAALLPASVRTELGKVDMLLQHFAEHRAEDPALTFISFLKLHYGQAFDDHQQEHNHSELPGKASHGHGHIIACGCTVLALPESLVFLLHPPAQENKSLTPTCPLLIPSSLASGIWQPPRIG